MEYKRVKYIENIQIPVRNLEQSVSWYEQHLGFRLKGYGNDSLAFLQLNETSHINLWQTDDDTTINFSRNGELMPAFVMVTEHMDRLHEDLRKGEATIVRYSDEGFAKGLTFLDPNGNVLLVLEYKG
ncbi:VOC family protein [Paenibacillus flagellatus]|uniref:Lactoylglutathione lyase n=1 Tax=Paenibacillus flagellatus TaxID=2211139 RepID=A0A2V5KG15_9BACL|nr:VOC family protein [Paenibacillus flagellatus]PYI53090.1 lactoylglutathione lyase [Paenibacillus flagellatus]